MDTLLSELAFRRREAEKMGGEAAVARQHAAGRLTVRERIRALGDPDSFSELGALTGTGAYDADQTLCGVTP
ncbi:MAG: propionyl-CoA carboxylase, partial [Alphaproteobacteria bacterium]|nr:propionyl-CoA carboxylase [Alphaproteobacteria bacterium]